MESKDYDWISVMEAVIEDFQAQCHFLSGTFDDTWRVDLKVMTFSVFPFHKSEYLRGYTYHFVGLYEMSMSILSHAIFVNTISFLNKNRESVPFLTVFNMT